MIETPWRYHVEELVRGGWAISDAFETYEAADTWAHTLISSACCSRGGVRVLDMERERAEIDAVVWSVLA